MGNPLKILPVCLLAICCVQKQKKVESPPRNEIPIKIESDRLSGRFRDYIIANHTEKCLEFQTYPVDSVRRVYSTMYYHTDSPWFDPGIYPRTNLSDELPDMKRLWDTAKTKIRIELQWISISPEKYKDLLRNYISLFQNSSLWKDYLTKNRRPDLNHVPIELILQQGNVYQPIENFLKSYGYSIIGYSTEESFYLTGRFLKANGYDSTLIIPMPLTCALQVRHDQPNKIN